MKVQDFIGLLEENPGRELKFSYQEGAFAGANYHLTEVKNVNFDTTDCGGKTNHWKETHMQIWENPEELGKTEFMTTDKILSILRRVDGINPLWRDTDLKFEYGNVDFNTGVMPVQNTLVDDKYMEVRLFEEGARCKANDHCGVPELAHQAAERVAEQAVEQEACCGPSNCC